MDERIAAHQQIRDDLVALLRAAPGLAMRVPEAGSYLFPRLPELVVGPPDFVRLRREQADMVVMPGTEFSPHHCRSVRLNFSQDRGRAGDGVSRMIELAQRCRRRRTPRSARWAAALSAGRAVGGMSARTHRAPSATAPGGTVARSGWARAGPRPPSAAPPCRALRSACPSC